jgi:hypothetical protein
VIPNQRAAVQGIAFREPVNDSDTSEPAAVFKKVKRLPVQKLSSLSG